MLIVIVANDVGGESLRARLRQRAKHDNLVQSVPLLDVEV
jgi:hypothetical protein